MRPHHLRDFSSTYEDLHVNAVDADIEKPAGGLYRNILAQLM